MGPLMSPFEMANADTNADTPDLARRRRQC